jgi:hypothetical protein
MRIPRFIVEKQVKKTDQPAAQINDSMQHQQQFEDTGVEEDDEEEIINYGEEEEDEIEEKQLQMMNREVASKYGSQAQQANHLDDEEDYGEE